MNHKNLDLWNLSIVLAVSVIRLTGELPNAYRFTLSDQMQRAAISISSNIAEGAARGSKKEFIRYLNIAAGSASELDTHLTILRELDILKSESLPGLQSSLDDISKMIQGLIRSIRNRLKCQ